MEKLELTEKKRSDILS
jgi:hypothetical protein